MNFLAHLHIADHTGTSLTGALAADFIRGPVVDDSSPLFLGVRLHRFVDAWIDRHDEVLDIKKLFRPAHRRMAGILLVLRFSEFDTKGNLIDQTIPVHRIKRRFHI